MAELLTTLSIIAFSVAGVCLAIAIALFIAFRIPGVIGDLSGSTARRSIAKLRGANEKSGVKSYRTDTINAERGKLTSTIPMTASIAKHLEQVDANKAWESISEGNTQDMPETGLLGENRANLISDSTVLLTPDPAVEEAPAVPREGGVVLNLLEEVMLVHTQEVIL